MNHSAFAVADRDGEGRISTAVPCDMTDVTGKGHPFLMGSLRPQTHDICLTPDAGTLLESVG